MTVSPDAPAPVVVDVPDSSRFELVLDGRRIGRAEYFLHGDVLTVPHVETDPAHRGNGFAATLMRGVLDSVRANGQTIRPLCGYADAYMRRHPGDDDLREQN